MTRWIRFFIVLIIGIGLGVLYGRVVNPVEYVDTTTESLRLDYKTDYVLMVSEVYQTHQDLMWAMNRLALLGCETPQACVEDALDFATEAGYASQDLRLIEDLYFALSGGE